MAKKRSLGWGLFLAAIIIGIGIYLVIGRSKKGEEERNQMPFQGNGQIKLEEEFCGSSSYGECENNGDCQTGGCSGQICQAKGEEEILTTCEYRSCYNAERYQKRCLCFDGHCQWR